MQFDNTTPAVALLYECHQLVSSPYPHSIRTFCSVYTDMLPETLVIFIERTEPLNDVAYRLSRNERFPV